MSDKPRGRQFKKGEPRPAGSGRGKGTPNKITRDLRLMIRSFVEHGWEHALKDYEKLRKKDPGYALRVFARLTEYGVPKLQRVEHVGEGGGPVKMEYVVVNTRPAPPPQESAVEGPPEEK